MVERGMVRSFSAIFVVLYIAHIVPTCLRLLHMLRQFAQHLLEGFGHRHNRQRIERARKSTGKIRQTGLSKKNC